MSTGRKTRYFHKLLPKSSLYTEVKICSLEQNNIHCDLSGVNSLIVSKWFECGAFGAEINCCKYYKTRWKVVKSKADIQCLHAPPMTLPCPLSPSKSRHGNKITFSNFYTDETFSLFSILLWIVLYFKFRKLPSCSI